MKNKKDYTGIALITCLVVIIMLVNVAYIGRIVNQFTEKIKYEKTMTYLSHKMATLEYVSKTKKIVDFNKIDSIYFTIEPQMKETLKEYGVEE